MDSENRRLLFFSFFKTIGYLFLFIVVGLFLDSTYMHGVISQTQHIATAVMFIGFTTLYLRSSARLREQMLYAVVIGYIGEHLFSIELGMYTYRLENDANGSDVAAAVDSLNTALSTIYSEFLTSISKL